MKWFHNFLVADRDSAIQLYIDGALAGEDTDILRGSVSSDLAMTLAQMSDGYYLTGSMDEFAIFGEALTAQQVLDHYNAATGTPLIPGDTNGNGVVNASDATILAGNWQASTDYNAVPEPSTILLLLTTLLTAGLIARKKR
ncbi:MAG: PEP-CTERM sorting domain-containing protein [Planctomycetia bacterium]